MCHCFASITLRFACTHRYPLLCRQYIRPDGDSPKTPVQSKWPLKPGVMVHINAMRSVNSVGQLSPTPLIQRSPRMEESPRRRAESRYDRGKSKVYQRLERLRDMLGFGGPDDGAPVGIYHSPGGGNFCVIFYT